MWLCREWGLAVELSGVLVWGGEVPFGHCFVVSRVRCRGTFGRDRWIRGAGEALAATDTRRLTLCESKSPIE